MVSVHYSPDHEPYFQGKDPQEKFQFYYRQHWIRLAPAAAKMIGSTILILLFGYMLLGLTTIEATFPRHLFILILCFSFIVTQFSFLSALYRYFLYVVIVTDRRVHRIKKTLLTTDDHESVDLWSTQDINKAQRGLFQNLFGFGTLTLQAQDTEMKLHFTPRITEKYKHIARLREQLRDASRLQM